MKRKRDLARRILTVLLTIVMIMPYCALALETSAVTSGENASGDQGITENGGMETYFSALPILEDATYTVKFYMQNPDNPEITDPTGNLIKEFTDVAFNTPLSDLVNQLDEEYKNRNDWTVSLDNTVVNNLSVWLAGENIAAIGGEEYEFLQDAIDAAADTTDSPVTIRLLKDTREGITSTASYTLDMQGHTITAPANSRVYEIKGGTVTMKNGTLTGGYNADADGGAGLRVSAGSAELINCTITNNHTGLHPFSDKFPNYFCGGDGGGLYAASGTSVTLTNCTISNNSTADGNYSDGNGGGLYAASSATVMLTDCEITGNTAASGGGLYAKGSQTAVTLTDCDITKNTASASGGGCYVSSSTLTLTRVSISENISNDAKLVRYPTFEDALVNITKDGTLTLKNITVDGMGGRTEASAALIDTYGTLNISEGAVLQNNRHTKSGSAGYTKSGGAVYCNGGTVNMRGGTISGNTSWYGGGIELWGGSMTMSGGTIADDQAVTHGEISPAGGGIAVLDDATLTLSGGSISGNTSAYDGGGISLGASLANTVNGPELTMTGGSVEGNSAELDGGGIMLQSTSKAYISGGSIVGNSCKGAQEGYGIFGGGIYVNAARHVSGNDYAQAELYLANVLITENKSNNRGGGLAGCNTSTTNIYLNDGSAIYDNTSEDSSQVYIEYVQQSGPGTPNISISEYMLGGGIYNWLHADTKTAVSANILQGESAKLPGYALDNAPSDRAKAAAEGKAQVIIRDNESGSHGGGIGSNGFVQIGTSPRSTEPDPDSMEIPVKKTWEYEDAEYTRPSTIRIWLKRNGDRVSYLDFSKGSDGTWPTENSFVNQPIEDANGEAYEYTLEEEQLLADGTADPNHIYAVTGNAEDGFEVTNRLRREILISKKVVNNVSDNTEEFTFVITLKNGDGQNLTDSLPAVYSYKGRSQNVKLELLEGKASFTLGDGDSILIQDVPEGATYSVKEESAKGYTSEPNDEQNGTIAVGRTVIAFSNTYSATGKAAIPVSKTLTGREWQNTDAFEVVLTEITAGVGGKEVADKLTSSQTITLTKASQTGSFELDYTAEGVHTYKIAETEKNENGITTDTSVYTVTDNLDGTLTATTNIQKTKDGKTTEATAVVFENIYKAPEKKPAIIPYTGDETPITLYLALLMTSTVLLAGIGFSKLRRSKK